MCASAVVPHAINQRPEMLHYGVIGPARADWLAAAHAALRPDLQRGGIAAPRRRAEPAHAGAQSLPGMGWNVGATPPRRGPPCCPPYGLPRKGRRRRCGRRARWCAAASMTWRQKACWSPATAPYSLNPRASELDTLDIKKLVASGYDLIADTYLWSRRGNVQQCGSAGFVVPAPFWSRPEEPRPIIGLKTRSAPQPHV